MKYKVLKSFEDNQIDDIVELDVNEETKSFIDEKISEGFVEELVEEVKEIKEVVEEKVEEKLAEVVETKAKGENIMETIEVKEQALSPEKKLVNSFKVAKALSTNKWDEETKAIVGQGETVSSDGGALVDNDIVADIYRMAMQTAVVAPKVAQRPVGEGYNVMQIRQLDQSEASAADYQGVQLSVVSEGSAITPDKVAFKTATASVNKVAALFAATSEIEQDTPGLMGYITSIVGEGFGMKLDDEVLYGTESLLTPLVGDASTSKVVVTPGAPNAAQIKALYFANINPSAAEWYMSTEGYEKVMGIMDAAGKPLVQPSYVVSPYGTLLGRPINMVPCMKATSANGAILFADMGRSYILGTKGGIKFAQSVHLFFDLDQNAYRWVLRVAGLPQKATTLTKADGKVVSVASQSVIA